MVIDHQDPLSGSDFSLERSISAIKKFIDELYKGQTVTEIIHNIAPEDIEDLQCVESQMAMITAVRQMGYVKSTDQLITEFLQQHSCESLMNTIGTNIFVEVLRNTPLRKEEVVTMFNPMDFEPTCVKEKIASILSLALQVNSAKVEETFSQCMKIINYKFMDVETFLIHNECCMLQVWVHGIMQEIMKYKFQHVNSGGKISSE
jgi:hypothetical protein